MRDPFLCTTLAFLAMTAGSHLPEPASVPTAKPAVRGKFVTSERMRTKGDTSEKDVVVFLRAKDSRPCSPPPEPLVVQQERLIFKPHVLAACVGTTVRFENLDTVTHNVFCADACCNTNLDMTPSSRSTVTLQTPGVASIFCRLHPDMSMFVVVLENRYFTTIELEKKDGPDGRRTFEAEFVIPDVEPGEYVLTFWNKKLKPCEVPVTVQAEQDTIADLVLGGG